MVKTAAKIGEIEEQTAVNPAAPWRSRLKYPEPLI
jgi:hypothetical protein